MVIRVAVSSESLGNVVFRPSPVNDVVAWLRLTMRGGRHPYLGSPGWADRRVLADPDVTLLRSLVDGSRYVPDFLTPKPAAPAPPERAQPGPRRSSLMLSLEEQLRQVASASPETAMEQIALHYRGITSCTGSRRMADRPSADDLPGARSSGSTADTIALRAARGLALVARVMGPRWGAIEVATSAAISRRSEQVGRLGLLSTLDGLHPQLTWRPDGLVIDKPFDETVQLDGQELVVSPSIVETDRLVVQVCDPENATLVLPTPLRGSARAAVDSAPPVGRRPSPRTSPADPGSTSTQDDDMTGLDDRLAGVFGRSRARVLQALTTPATTTDLSVRLGLAKSTVAHHLAHLSDAGLLDASRVGKNVYYQHSSRAHHLF